MKRKVESLDEEQSRQKQQIEKVQESQSLLRSDIQRIFEDIDRFKKQSQTMSQDQLKLEREIQRLENVRIADLKNLLDIHSRKMLDFEAFKEKSFTDAKDKQQDQDGKFATMSKEMQTVKSQIYYLQQSVLQLRGAFKNTDDEASAVASLPISIPG